MLIIGIGGLPASGKSTLVKELRKKLNKPKIFKYGMIKGEHYEPNLFILGTYNRKFGGTDTLSMAVQPHAERFIETMKDKHMIVLFEGDRLFNSKFIQKIIDLGIDYKFYMLIADPEIIEQRHIDRNDTQSEQWLQGRKTKLKTIYEKFVTQIKLLHNKNKEHLLKNVNMIWQDLKNTI